MKSLIVLTLTICYVYGQNISCFYSGVGAPACTRDITEWSAASSDTYNCNGGVSPISIDTAAYTTATRKNVETLTNQEIHVLLKSFTCALSNQNVTKGNYAMDNWVYVGTMHGEPGWFPQCQDQDNGRGLEPPGCCSHNSPAFVTWHRILMVQYDNSLKQWDLDAFSPYWNWMNYIGTDFPDLLSKPSIRDPILNVTVQNPFWNYRLPDSIYDAIPTDQPKCRYACRSPDAKLFSWGDSSRTALQDSWYRQVIQAFFYDYFVPFDFMFEIPHNNIHNLIGGNMPNLWTVMGDPIFMFHHSEVERLFLIWQLALKKRDIDYTDKDTQCKYMGCLKSHFKLDDPILPFWTGGENDYNVDPIGKKYSESPLKAMEWSGMYYKYDTLDFNGMNLTELAIELTRFHTDEMIFLGFHFNYLDYKYTVHYSITRYGETDVIKSGFFTILGKTANPWENIAKYLYRVDITHALIEYGIDQTDFEYEMFNVDITIDTERSDISYTTQETGVYHPFIIYRDGATGKEIHNIIWSSAVDYQGSSFILGIDENYYNHTVRLIYSELEAEDVSDGTSVTYYNKKDHQNGAIYTYNESYAIYTNINASWSYTEYIYYVGSIEYGDVSNLICIECLYAFGRNELTQSNGISINLYPNQDSWQGYSSYDMFNNLQYPTANTILPNGTAAEQGHLIIPWNSAYIKSNLYNTVYEHQTDLGSIQFQNCPKDDVTVIQVATEDEYNNCDTSTPLVCGVNAYAKLNFEAADQTYYFIANTTNCSDGFKVAVHVADKTDNPCTEFTGFTSTLTANGSYTHKDGKVYTIDITVASEGVAPSITLDITGPSAFTWFAWGLFGPWAEKDGQGSGPMKGMAAVWVKDQCPNHYNLNMYYLQGNGIHPQTAVMQCSSHSDSNGIVKCTVSHTMCKEWLQYSNVNKTIIKPNVEYVGRFAYNQNGSPGFNNQHDKGNPDVFKYTFKEMSEPDSMETTYYTEDDGTDCVPNYKITLSLSISIFFVICNFM